MNASSPATRSGQSILQVSVLAADSDTVTRRFSQAFQVGRDVACGIRIEHSSVSRRHLQFEIRDGVWWLRDLDSRNGIYINGQRSHQVPIDGPLQVSLGQKGPRLDLCLVTAAEQASPENHVISEQPVVRMQSVGRLATVNEKAPASSHTAMRRAFQLASKRQKRRYRSLLVLVMLLLSVASTIAVYQYFNVRKLSNLAVDIFYAMKTLELQTINIQSVLAEGYESAQEQYREQIVTQQRQLDALQRQYAEFVAQIHAAKLLLNDEDRLILHVARLFGECEANAPPDFVDEVKRYIKRWQSSDRLRSAIRRLRENQYTTVIAEALKSQRLPAQFLYLALQESNFRIDAVGPITRYGHAKGMWQFIPQTGARYGLQTGPLVNEGVYDAADERHDFVKATFAAARYLRDIYRTDAQASALLVMASYNWGEGNIIRLLRQLPENPRERNFWELLKHHTIPNETYDYVFYIVAAAVIGENPRLFGFDFDNPLLP